MKQLLICIIMALCVCVSACTGKQKSEETENAEPNDDWGITAQAVEWASTRAVVGYKYHGDDTEDMPSEGIEEYSLERWNGTAWEPVEQIFEGDVVFAGTEEPLIPGGTREWSFNWEWLYGSLPEGTYRIGKEFSRWRSGILERQMFYAEFNL